MATRIVWAAKTDVGLKRTRNEDNFIMVPSQGLYVLADGMGGHSSGQVASTLCVKHVSQFICEIAKQPGFEFKYPTNPNLSYEANLLVNAIKFANERVFIQSCKERSMEGMGTTVTAIFNAPHGFILAHVGDSRIYRIRKGQIQQMSRDHSLLNHLLDTGELKPEDVPNFANKNVILRAIGLKESVEVDVKEVKREQGDVYLMCSDGLSDLVSDAQIAQTVSNSPDLQEACNTLIGLALKAGGKDNVTVVTVGIDQEDGTVIQPRHVSQTMQAAKPAPQPVPDPARNTGLQNAPKAARNGMPPMAMNPRRGMAPKPAATSNIPGLAASPLRLHSVREYVITDVAPVVAKRAMPKPISGRAAMPAIPGLGSTRPTNETEPAEAIEAAKNISNDDLDDEEDAACATRIQSRDEILREIGILPAGAPTADPSAVDSPRQVNASDKLQAERPNADLLLMAPPTAADEASDKTVIEEAIPEELVASQTNYTPDPAPTRTAGSGDSRFTMAPQSSEEFTSISNSPVTTGYVAPKGVVKPPKDYYENDEDSIEIFKPIYEEPDDDEDEDATRQLTRPPFWHK